jgi:ubiquinone/menaquinone biosynthesis C-methylase UbiE
MPSEMCKWATGGLWEMKMNHIEKTIKTYDIIASKYCRKTLIPKVRKFEHNLLDKFLKMIKIKNPKLLDIGCGDGRDTAYLLEQGADVIGIDLSGSMLEEAKKNVLNGNFIKMDMRRLEFPDGQFDGVWASGCVYHVTKDEFKKVLREIHRVLKRNGVFSFNFKLGEGEGLEENPKSYAGHPRYFAYYSLEEIRNFLKDFKFIEHEQYPEKIFGDSIVHLWCRKR